MAHTIGVTSHAVNRYR